MFAGVAWRVDVALARAVPVDSDYARAVIAVAFLAFFRSELELESSGWVIDFVDRFSNAFQDAVGTDVEADEIFTGVERDAERDFVAVPDVLSGRAGAFFDLDEQRRSGDVAAAASFFAFDFLVTDVAEYLNHSISLWALASARADCWVKSDIMIFFPSVTDQRTCGIKFRL